jgi:chaperonin GroEL
MLQGILKMADAVAVTLGPGGRNVGLDKAFGSPVVTKDGVSVAKEIELFDRFENLGSKLLQEVASKTSDDAGDGTTTAIVIARYLAQHGIRLVEANHPPVAIKRGMDMALPLLDEVILKMSSPIQGPDHIASIATISANGDRSIGEIIAKAVAMVGKDGIVNIEEGKTMSTTLETTDGLKFDRGWANPFFCLDIENQSGVLENPFVLVTDMVLSNVKMIVPLVEEIAKQQRSLFIIAPDYSGDFLPMFVVNLAKGKFTSILVKAPAFGAQQVELLQDIAVLTGATMLSKNLGMTLESLTLEMLGTVRHVTVKVNSTTLVDGGGSAEAIDYRVRQIKAEIASSGSEYDKDKLRERMAKLLGGICVIKVGAVSELAMKELKARMEDALYATKASIDEGVSPGGGIAYLRAAQRVTESLQDEKAAPQIVAQYDLPVDDAELEGFKIVLRACEEPLRQMISNAGHVGEVYVEKVLALKDHYVGIDFTDFQFKDMREAGILDPTKVVRSALANAVSVVGTLLLTEVGICKPKEIKSTAASA